MPSFYAHDDASLFIASAEELIVRPQAQHELLSSQKLNEPGWHHALSMMHERSARVLVGYVIVYVGMIRHNCNTC